MCSLTCVRCGLPNQRWKPTGALVLKEAVVSCPGGHGTFVTSFRQQAGRPQLKRDPLGRVMPQSPLRLIKHYAEYLPADRISEIPYGVRGIYVLYRHRLRSKAYDVVYVGLAGVGKRSGMRGRLL